MKHLLDQNSEIIIRTRFFEILEDGRNYKNGDEVLCKQIVESATWHESIYDQYGNLTGLKREITIRRSEIEALYKRMLEIESAEPVKGTYQEMMPF